MVDVGSVPQLTLASDSPLEGQPIAVAGYPYFQVDIAEHKGGLSPAVHVGNVNALPFGGYYIEHDALTDHGNSGGPLFDQSTGLVYGIVTYGVQSKTSSAVQNNLAISIKETAQFLQNAHMTSGSGVAHSAATSRDQADFITKIEPAYPEAARENNIQGTVVVAIMIGPDGKIVDASVAESSGSDLLDEAALQAAEDSTYRAPTVHGIPTARQYKIEYDFRLSN